MAATKRSHRRWRIYFLLSSGFVFFYSIFWDLLFQDNFAPAVDFAFVDIVVVAVIRTIVYLPALGVAVGTVWLFHRARGSLRW